MRIRNRTHREHRRLRAAAREARAHKGSDSCGVGGDDACPHLVVEDKRHAVLNSCALHERRLDAREVHPVPQHLDDRIEPPLDAQPFATRPAAIARRVDVDYCIVACAIGLTSGKGLGVLARQVAVLHVPAPVDDAARLCLEEHLVSPNDLAVGRAAHGHVGEPRGGCGIANGEVDALEHADVGSRLGRREHV